MTDPIANVGNLFSALPIIRNVVDLGGPLQNYRTTLSLYGQFALENNLDNVCDSVTEKMIECADLIKMHQSACKYLQAMNVQRKMDNLPQ